MIQLTAARVQGHNASPQAKIYAIPSLAGYTPLVQAVPSEWTKEWSMDRHISRQQCVSLPPSLVGDPRPGYSYHVKADADDMLHLFLTVLTSTASCLGNQPNEG